MIPTFCRYHATLLRGTIISAEIFPFAHWLGAPNATCLLPIRPAKHEGQSDAAQSGQETLNLSGCHNPGPNLWIFSRIGCLDIAVSGIRGELWEITREATQSGGNI